MQPDNYSIEAFVSDLRRIVREHDDEAAILSAASPLAQRIAASSSWRNARHYNADPAQGFGATVLHVEPDQSLLVVAASWLPDRGAPPHDHGTWAVIVGVDGAEENTLWERVDDSTRPGYAEIRTLRIEDCAPGSVLTMPSGSIHSVVNRSARTTLSFHVYGMHVNRTERFQYDVGARTATPLKITTQE